MQEHLDGASDSFSVLANIIGSGLFSSSSGTTLPLQLHWKQPAPPKPTKSENVFHESPKFPRQEQVWRPPPESLNDHIMKPSAAKPVSVPQVAPPRDISSSVTTSEPMKPPPRSENPFEEDDDCNNPFNEDFADERLPANPFEEEEDDDTLDEKNPFADDYDESKNPFAEDNTYNDSLNPFED